MKLSIDREHIRKVAEELNFDVEFDAETSGVRNPHTGEIQSFSSVMSEFLKDGFSEATSFEVLDDLSGVGFNLAKPNFINTKQGKNVFPDHLKTQFAS